MSWRSFLTLFKLGKLYESQEQGRRPLVEAF
jgi:hypothetical protein